MQLSVPKSIRYDLELRFDYKSQNYVGFLTKSGIIRNSSLQTACPDSYQAFIKIKNFFIIKFRNKIIFKDENDIVNFELNNTNVVLYKISEFLKMIYKEYLTNIMIFFILMIFVLILTKKFIFKKRGFSKLLKTLFKRNNELDNSVIFLESVPVQNQLVNEKRRKSKDKCVQFIDYDMLDSEKPKTTRSLKKQSKK
jgi:hypothetical protein